MKRIMAVLASLAVLAFAGCDGATITDFMAAEGGDPEALYGASSSEDTKKDTLPEGCGRLAFESGTYGVRVSVLVPKLGGWVCGETTSNTRQSFAENEGGCSVVFDIDAVTKEDAEKPKTGETLKTSSGIEGFSSDENGGKKLTFLSGDDYLGGSPRVTVTVSGEQAAQTAEKIAQTIEITVGDLEENLFDRSGQLEYAKLIALDGRAVKTQMKLVGGSKRGFVTYDEEDGTTVMTAELWESGLTQEKFEALAENADYTEDKIAGRPSYFKAPVSSDGKTRLECVYEGGNGKYYIGAAEVNVPDADTERQRELLRSYINGARYHSDVSAYISEAEAQNQ